MNWRQHTVRRAAALVLFLVYALAAHGQAPSPHAIDVPPWFERTFLDFREDIADAARQGKRLMVYFGQDGCPYCTRLMKVNFSQRDIVDRTRRQFVAVEINIWGDRETTWLDGRTRSEKELAALLAVQFTPTLLFFDERGEIVARLNGYYPPARFRAALDYVAGRMEGRLSFAEHMQAAPRETASATLNPQPFFMEPPLDLTRGPAAKPLAVVFETTHCAGCDEMHRESFPRAAVREQLARLDVARVVLGSTTPLTTPAGRPDAAGNWARELGVAYAPSIVFFAEGGREVFRVEGQVRPFHLASALEYVGSGSYRSEPSFQRFLQQKAERMRSRGQPVELWK
jgi:thioredoxin-related protein